jgi:hypothetical protein
MDGKEDPLLTASSVDVIEVCYTVFQSSPTNFTLVGLKASAAVDQ